MMSWGSPIRIHGKKEVMSAIYVNCGCHRGTQQSRCSPSTSAGGLMTTRASGKPSRPIITDNNASRQHQQRRAQHQYRYHRLKAAGRDDGQDLEATRASSVRELPSTFAVLAQGGRWQIRQIDRTDLDEVRQVVMSQAEGFHVPNALPFLDGFLKTSFTAEVLSEMQKKLKYNPVDKFVLLVVERVGPAGGASPVEGVVEVSFIDEKEVLQSLEPGTEGVAYVASMAVAPSARRQGAAKALLEGATSVCREWGEAQAVLHVYQDNEAAVRLYSQDGWVTIFQDNPGWAMVGVRL